VLLLSGGCLKRFDKLIIFVITKGSIPELAPYYKVTWMTSRLVPHAWELGREEFFDRVLYMHVRDFEFLILEMARTRIFKQKSGAL